MTWPNEYLCRSLTAEGHSLAVRVVGIIRSGFASFIHYKVLAFVVHLDRSNTNLFNQDDETRQAPLGLLGANQLC